MVKKIRNIIFPIVIILACLTISHIVFVSYKGKDILSAKELVEYYGLFLGFGLTIYTFIISIFDNIIKRIDSNKKIQTKEKIVNGLFNGIRHLKQDVIGIFIVFVIEIVLLILENNLSDYVDCYITFKYALFLYSITILFDICRVLFGIADVSLSLLKNRKHEEEN